MNGSRKKPLPSSHMWSSPGGTALPVSRAKGQATFQRVRTFDPGKDDSPAENLKVPTGLLLPDRAFTLGGNVTVVDGAPNSNQLSRPDNIWAGCTTSVGFLIF